MKELRRGCEFDHTTAVFKLIECGASQIVAGDALNLDGRMFPFVPDFTATVITHATLHPSLCPLFHQTVTQSHNYSRTIHPFGHMQVFSDSCQLLRISRESFFFLFDNIAQPDVDSNQFAFQVISANNPQSNNIRPGKKSSKLGRGSMRNGQVYPASHGRNSSEDLIPEMFDTKVSVDDHSSDSEDSLVPELKIVPALGKDDVV